MTVVEIDALAGESTPPSDNGVMPCPEIADFLRYIQELHQRDSRTPGAGERHGVRIRICLICR
jgi:hypothetical protein